MKAPDDSQPAPLVGRLAPSPTGKLHLGHARSFLLAWWSVRSRGGRILLRMEDLDPDRVKAGDADGVLRDLEWLGLDWDGEVMWQSQRTDAYREALATLAEAGAIYPCICTRKEIASAAEAPHGTTPESMQVTPAAAQGDRYPGTCRDRFRSIEAARAASGRDAAWRFRTESADSQIVFEDAVHGCIQSNVAAEVGDFPLTRKDGVASYQLAVVVDDAAQAITEVLRGDDLLSSSARQILLMRSLGYPQPRFLHVPVVTDESGRRLAKRTDDLSLHELRERGVDPRRIVCWAARSTGLDCSAPARPDEFLEGFSLDRLPRMPQAIGERELAGWSADL